MVKTVLTFLVGGMEERGGGREGWREGEERMEGGMEGGMEGRGGKDDRMKG